MLTDIKVAVYQLVSDLGYNITDSRNYEESFPWLMLHTNNYQVSRSFDIKYEMISLTIDIFSTYNGEKEIIDIAEDIGNHIQSLREKYPEITMITQAAMRIIQDKSKGPVCEHGVLTYQFILTSGMGGN